MLIGKKAWKPGGLKAIKPEGLEANNLGCWEGRKSVLSTDG